LKVGERHLVLGVTVKTIIFDSDECVVFLDEHLDTYWDTDETTTPEMGLVFNRVSELEAIPLEGLSEAAKLAFRTMVAEGVARALDDEDNKSAEKIHNQAEAFVRARLAELARSWYLTTGLFALLLAALVMGLEWFFLRAEVYATYAMCLAAGAAGAAFSLIARIGSFPLDPAAGRRLHTLEAVARVLVGVLGAFLAVLAVKSKLLLAPVAEQGLPSFLLIAFVAGSSERFVPNLVQRVEDASFGKPGAAPAGVPKRTEAEK
jgi:hypothetical protein